MWHLTEIRIHSVEAAQQIWHPEIGMYPKIPDESRILIQDLKLAGSDIMPVIQDCRN